MPSREHCPIRQTPLVFEASPAGQSQSRSVVPPCHKFSKTSSIRSNPDSLSPNRDRKSRSKNECTPHPQAQSLPSACFAANIQYRSGSSECPSDYLAYRYKKSPRLVPPPAALLHHG